MLATTEYTVEHPICVVSTGCAVYVKEKQIIGVRAACGGQSGLSKTCAREGLGVPIAERKELSLTTDVPAGRRGRRREPRRDLSSSFSGSFITAGPLFAARPSADKIEKSALFSLFLLRIDARAAGSAHRSLRTTPPPRSAATCNAGRRRRRLRRPRARRVARRHGCGRGSRRSRRPPRA